MYSCGCSDCNHQKEVLNLGLKNKFKPLLKEVEKAFKKLHKKGSYKPEDLETVKEYRAIVTETTGILNRALNDNDLSDEMLDSLQNDVFLFSELRTHAELFEASRLLLDDDKNIKSFNTFSKDVAAIKKNYNETYLESEYEFAVGSVQMVERWENFGESERYLLQYRTAGDNKVRDTHQVLHNTTLPKTDKFWDSFFPPNGWRCRCTTLEVLASKNEPSDSKEAYKKGDKATTQIGKNNKNKLEIFRFNPGKQKVVFPPKHPYNKVAGATKVKTNALSKIDSEKRVLRKAKDVEVREWVKNNIPEGGKTVKLNNFKTKNAVVLRKNVRGIADHFTNPNLKNISKDVFVWLKECEYKESASLKDSNIAKSIKNIDAKKQRGVTGYNYYSFKWNDEKYRLNVELIEGKEYPFSVNKIVDAK